MVYHPGLCGASPPPNPALISAKRYIQVPIQRILYPPVRAHRVTQPVYIVDRGDEVARLDTDCIAVMVLCLHSAYRLQARPPVRCREGMQVRREPVPAVLHPTVPTVRSLDRLHLRPSENPSFRTWATECPNASTRAKKPSTAHKLRECC